MGLFEFGSLKGYLPEMFLVGTASVVVLIVTRGYRAIMERRLRRLRKMVKEIVEQDHYHCHH